MSKFPIKTFTAIDFLKHEEGLRLHSYLDTGGVWTIGFGHTGPEVVGGLMWTLEQCVTALRFDMSGVINYVNNLQELTPNGFTQGQFDALCDLIFNWGPGNFENEHKSFLHDMVISDPNDPKIIEVWQGTFDDKGNVVKEGVGVHDAHGNRLDDLVNRRKHECTLYQS